MINPGFIVLIKREVMRFMHLWKQTIMPGLISSALYIIVFGEALGKRIGPMEDKSYITFIIPGLTMMSVINMAYQNSSSSIMQAKFLKFIEDDQTYLEREPLEKATTQRQLVAFKHKGFWQCMDTQRDKDKLNKALNSKKIKF